MRYEIIEYDGKTISNYPKSRKIAEDMFYEVLRLVKQNNLIDRSIDKVEFRQIKDYTSHYDQYSNMILDEIFRYIIKIEVYGYVVELEREEISEVNLEFVALWFEHFVSKSKEIRI